MERELVLHFDVNKTILMSDLVQDKSSAAVLNELLADNTFGRYDSQSGSWTASDVEQRAASAGSPSEVITYSNYVRRHRSGEADMLREHFTQAGQPGEALRAELMRLEALLAAQPEAVAKASPQIQLAPSIYFLLDCLVESKRSFKFIIRTFGTDAAEVCKALTAYARSKAASNAAWARYQFDEARDFGHLKRRDSDTVEFSVSDGVHARHSFGELRNIELARVIQQKTDEHPLLALQDDYEYWHAHGKVAHAGKLFLIEGAHMQCSSADKELDGAQPVQVFFDDKIKIDEANIVDARCSRCGQTLDFQSVSARHLVRVNSLAAISQHDYFVQCLNSIEARM
mmetsp:Transcript_7937/g.21033  ORF Transcript_7937/g.21033 Transcript_7937/m.21033 type:complete len:342 (-) Transcript_7937:1283-2308(-)